MPHTFGKLKVSIWRTLGLHYVPIKGRAATKLFVESETVSAILLPLENELP